ncbi:uncharacterized protein TNCV_2240221 [Trichonephila clavipes]|nr:uncharacterized protein TNCV_2240221 [Trichonephila clavipes]
MVSYEYIWPTLRCRREAGVSPLLSIGWWYLSLVSPKRHCCRVSAADKGCQVYPLDPRPDAVALYSGCTPATRGLLATDHVILNHGQVTWTTPELAPPSPNYHTTPMGGLLNVAAQSNNFV